MAEIMGMEELRNRVYQLLSNCPRLLAFISHQLLSVYVLIAGFLGNFLKSVLNLKDLQGSIN